MGKLTMVTNCFPAYSSTFSLQLNLNNLEAKAVVLEILTVLSRVVV